MNSHVADDFHAALLALKELETEGYSETPAEEETVQLVDEVIVRHASLDHPKPRIVFQVRYIVVSACGKVI